ncbi:MAG: hypothetical protein JW820_14035 [Spirochaetales bacterium]|nr:hypothetical protein [Spirochaetales bacterium]
MKHRSAVLISLIAILAIVAGTVLWAGPKAAGSARSAGSAQADVERPIGRDVARLGIVQSLEGTLRYEDQEWLLACGQTVYDLHLGPIGHETDLPFREGAQASVRGFVHGTHAAPIVVVSEGNESRFWNEDRTPSWAGQGDRRNAVSQPRSGSRASGPRAGVAEPGYRNEPPGLGRNRN